jgi:Immunity protein 26
VTDIIMANARKLVPGTFVRIPLEDGSFGYGRVLGDPYMAFYNYRTTEPSSDLADISSKPVLFRQSVRLFDYARWANIGHRELEGEVAMPSVFFMQSIGNFRKCTIFDSAGMERSATPEECIGLERAAVWDPHHIEERLLDTFMGRPNEGEMRTRVRLSD